MWGLWVRPSPVGRHRVPALSSRHGGDGPPVESRRTRDGWGCLGSASASAPGPGPGPGPGLQSEIPGPAAGRSGTTDAPRRPLRAGSGTVPRRPKRRPRRATPGRATPDARRCDTVTMPPAVPTRPARPRPTRPSPLRPQPSPSVRPRTPRGPCLSPVRADRPRWAGVPPSHARAERSTGICAGQYRFEHVGRRRAAPLPRTPPGREGTGDVTQPDRRIRPPCSTACRGRQLALGESSWSFRHQDL